MPGHQTQQRAIALFVAGAREDVAAVTRLVEHAVDDGGARELADTLIGLALVAGQIIRDLATDEAQLEVYLDALPVRFALEEGDGR